jgi:L-lactate utilization protein LutB
MAKKKSKEKSNCCHAKVRVSGIGDFEGDKIACTLYYICTKCNQPCDVYIPIRRTWNINPVTKVKGDSRGKEKEKLTKKEIEEFRRNEDF